MRIRNTTDVDTAALKKLAEAARQHVIAVDERVATWGPEMIIFNAEGTNTTADEYFVKVIHRDESATDILRNIIMRLRAWGGYVAGRNAGWWERAHAATPPDPILYASILESAGVVLHGARLPAKPVEPEVVPTRAEQLRAKLRVLALREKRWTTKAKRAATALKKITAERRRLERRLAQEQP